MPKSRHPKKKTPKRRKFLDLDEPKSPILRIRIRRHRFREIKHNPDFLALIKVGRAVNAVISGIQFISDYMNDDSPVGRRQYYRAFFTTCGFLYEGLNLANSIRLNYIKEPFFSKLNVLISDEYKQHRKVLKEIRQISFHLDSEDKSTKLALSNLKLKRYDLASGKSDLMMEFYFDMADTIDLNYLIDKFKDGRSEPDVHEEIVKMFTDVMKNFGSAGHEFLTGLAGKINISEYVE